MLSTQFIQAVSDLETWIGDWKAGIVDESLFKEAVYKRADILCTDEEMELRAIDETREDEMAKDIMPGIK